MGSDVHPMNVPSDLPLTLGELRASGWVSRPVKEEVHEKHGRQYRRRKPAVRRCAWL